jgi:hypothetical protein
MAKLSDTQLVILSTACQRDDRLVLPLPDRLKGGAATKVISSLLAKGLVKEVRAKLNHPAWRETDDDKRLTLMATDAAIEALGIEPDDVPTGADEAPDAEAASQGAQAPVSAPTAPAGRKSRKRAPGTAKPKSDKGPRQNKGEAMLAMLQRPEGATIAEIAEAFGWLPHTIRAAMSTKSRKASLTIASEKVDGRGRVYRAT